MGSRTKAQGDRTEAHILAAVVERGFAPSLPFGDNQRYDLILDDGRALLRVQCKTGWLAGGCVVFAVSSKNGFTGVRRPYQGDVEIFLVYCPELKKVFRVPASFANKNEMRLRLDPTSPRSPKTTIRWAKDFEF